MDERHRPREEEERPRIRVTDRRLFDREGNLRVPIEEQDTPAGGDETGASARQPVADATEAESPAAAGEAAANARAEAKEPVSSPRHSEPAQSASEADRQSARHAFDAAAAGAASPRDMPRDFASFVESQYYETLLFLGAIRHPQTGEVIEDLDMARYKIDLLAMLQEKTEGNRTPEESKLLDDVLYQLRMLYLQKSKAVKL